MIYQLYIQKNDQWQKLDLPSDFNLSMILNSGFLGKIQTGSFSFSSSLPPTPNNCTTLQNAQNPQILVDRKMAFPAKFLIGSSEFYSWYFVLRDSQDTGYKFDLVQSPGNQPRNFYEKKLWQLNFGKLELDSIVQKSSIWAIDLYDDKKLYQYFISPPENPIQIIFGSNLQLPNPVYFEIWINNVMIAQTPTGGTADSAEYWFNEKDPEKRFAIVTKNIVDYTIVLSIPKRGKGAINVVQQNSQVFNSVTLKIFEHYLSNNIEKGEFIVQYELTNLSYNDVTESINAIAKDPQAYPFKFLTYYNDAYYPSDNTQYEGIVNQYDTLKSDNTLKLNSGININTYPISPCFSLIFILEKVAALMGYSLQAPIFSDKIASGDDYLGEVYMINNVDFAEQITGTTIPTNVYGKVMTYANFMPDMTVKEFIDAIRTTFCLAIEYDYTTQTMVVSKCKTVLSSGAVMDISGKITRSPLADIQNKTYFQLKFRNGDSNVQSQQNYPTDESIADDGKEYTSIELGFTPVLNNTDIDPFLVNDTNPYIPTVSDQARTVMYLDQKTLHPTPRICFYLGNGSNGLSWCAKSDNKNTVLCMSFLNQGTLKGLLFFYEDYLEFLNNTIPWTAEIWLTELELANFKFTQKVYAYGTSFLVESINPKFPVKEKMKIKLLSL